MVNLQHPLVYLHLVNIKWKCNARWTVWFNGGRGDIMDTHDKSGFNYGVRYVMANSSNSIFLGAPQKNYLNSLFVIVITLNSRYHFLKEELVVTNY